MGSKKRFIHINHLSLNANTLKNLLEEYVTREGTDYGANEVTLDTKVREVEQQLNSGEATIIFDADEERANIVVAPKTQTTE